MLPSFLLPSLVLAHPSVDGHLHATEVRCGPTDGAPTDPMQGTITAIRRAGVLSDAGRTPEALAELDAACLPDAEVTVLARARTLVHGDRPTEALDVLEGLRGADASLWRAQALLALDRHDEAGALLQGTLPQLPGAPPETYLQAAELVGPCPAQELLALGLERRGDVGSLRRAEVAAAWSCDPTSSAPLDRLRSDQVRDLLLAGELLAARGRSVEAQRQWADAASLLETQRDTPARRALQAELAERAAEVSP